MMSRALWIWSALIGAAPKVRRVSFTALAPSMMNSRGNAGSSRARQTPMSACTVAALSVAFGETVVPLCRSNHRVGSSLR